MKPEDKLGRLIKIKIDHPMGSKNSEHNYTYPVNFGHAIGMVGNDGEELSAYLLGVFEPVDEYKGRLIGIIYRENDVNETLVIAPRIYTDEQIMALTEFQERWYVSWIAHIYDKHCWPDEFSVNTPEVQEAIRAVIKKGEFSPIEIMSILKKGYGRCTTFGFWLADNGVIEKMNNTQLKKSSSMKAKLKVKTYEEAIEKLA